MATYTITRVRTERPYGAAHEHITHVELNNNPAVIISRSTVIADLKRPYGDRYITNAGGVRANVIVVTCPHCTFRDYITTEPDWTTTNNLLSLPRC
ncbi:MAG TPA: DUF3892 domain-containing protein [Gaiellaceae bacterium]|nr:DUF3892 domain-containing protein [Gaiellaceae bacterium]